MVRAAVTGFGLAFELLQLFKKDANSVRQQSRWMVLTYHDSFSKSHICVYSNGHLARGDRDQESCTPTDAISQPKAVGRIKQPNRHETRQSFFSSLRRQESWLLSREVYCC